MDARDLADDQMAGDRLTFNIMQLAGFEHPALHGGGGARHPRRGDSFAVQLAQPRHLELVCPRRIGAG